MGTFQKSSVFRGLDIKSWEAENTSEQGLRFVKLRRGPLFSGEVVSVAVVARWIQLTSAARWQLDQLNFLWSINVLKSRVVDKCVVDILCSVLLENNISNFALCFTGDLQNSACHALDGATQGTGRCSSWEAEWTCGSEGNSHGNWSSLTMPGVAPHAPEILCACFLLTWH